jgi:cytidylate kinase
VKNNFINLPNSAIVHPMNKLIPIITIDGPSGTGKGTVSERLARALGFHYLDSGAIYRVLAYQAVQQGIELNDEAGLIDLAEHLDVKFSMDTPEKTILLEGKDITDAIRTETISQLTSKISSFGGVRAALLARQQAFAMRPGLVTDGRDMGTVVFPDADLKIYMTASAKERASRRYQQLKSKGIDANLAEILSELQLRDERDSQRQVAPLKPATDAIVIDTTELGIEEVFDLIMAEAKRRHINN